MTFSRQILDFYDRLIHYPPTPDGVSVLLPHLQPEARRIMGEFYPKYYGDQRPRTFLFGINPGRFGAGVTGVPFSDPQKLAEHCGISSDLPPRTELSAGFIFQVIEAAGGPEAFYGQAYITSTCPLGFVKDGKNFNYYDDKQLQRSWTPFMVEAIRRQLAFGAKPVAGCIGQGQNFKFLQKLNAEHDFFARIEALPHPRWVMQYRRRELNIHLNRYLEFLAE